MTLRRFSVAGSVLAFFFVVLALAPAASQAAPCDAPVTNQVACENTKAGTPESTWKTDGVGDESIQGFATAASVNRGSQISFKIKSATANYKIDIYRIGYYQGNGARLQQGNIPKVTSLLQNQPACATQASTGLIDCGNWAVSANWTVPSTSVSGLYIAHLVRNDTGGDSQIPFVVRNDAGTEDVVVQTSDATWQAYNDYGGNSLYHCTTAACPNVNPDGYYAALAVSYNRPYATNGGEGLSWWYSAEYPMIRFLEANGYNAAYTSQLDTEERGNLIRNHKLFISSGHDEYWSQNQRNSMEAARDNGVNLAFFSGNTGFWRTRYAAAIAGTPTTNRTLVSYKDTHFQAPTDPVTWTGTWRDRRFGGNYEPENSLIGTSFITNAGTTAMQIPASSKGLRMWRNTDVANLSSGSVTLAPGTLGYEWDQDADNGFRPPGTIKLSSQTVSGVDIFTDYGTTVTNGTATHHMTLYKKGNARVFSSATVQWAWGLDSANPNGNPSNRNQRQATVNLFADMDAQPSTRQSDLAAAAKTTDTTAPTATISSPSNGATIADGTQTTISGTATDAGGGTVGGVEVSTDGGTTWRPATGTTSWTFSWAAHGTPAANIKVRATDDSGNIQTPGAGNTVNITCPCGIWGNGFTPQTVDSGDTNSGEFGVKFKSTQYGKITGIRFYKSAANTGTHVGSLWSSTGTRLASVTFTGESASGWQTATFSQPVTITPNTTYVASYFAPNGRYSVSPSYFYPKPAPPPHGYSITKSGPLSANENTSTDGNGVFTYASAAGTFPTLSFGASNYWVDVQFSPVAAPGTVTNVTAVAGGRTSANVSWTAPSTGGEPTSYEVIPYVGSTAQATRTVNGVNGGLPPTTTTVTGLTQGTTYTFRVRAVNPNGNGTLSNASNAVTPQTAVAPATPGNVNATAASQSAKVTWSTPASDGDSPITGYKLTPYIGAAAQPVINVAAGTNSRTVTGLTNGTAYTFRIAATNAAGDSPQSPATAAVTPQATIFDFTEPAVADGNDPNPIEVGVKFTPDTNGQITGIRFFKAAANTGTHTGSLWTTSGTRLAQVTFTNESASGWQTATFASPVSVTAGTTYIASYFTPSGHYSGTGDSMGTVTANPPLRTISNNASPNGVYLYGASGGFPANSYNASNYWVDVMFAVPAPGTPGTPTATATSSTSARVTWTAPTTGGGPTSYRITPYIGATAQTPTEVTGSPLPLTRVVTGLNPNTTYTFRVQAVNAQGAGTASAASNSVTLQGDTVPAAPESVVARPATNSVRVEWNAPETDGGQPLTGYTVTPYDGAAAQTPVDVAAGTTARTIAGLNNGTAYTFRVTARNSIGTSAQSAASNAATPRATIFEFATPGSDGTDTNSVELGVKFQSTTAGSITGIRFYKAAGNTGQHIGSLWTASGTRLAQATFTNESASGWQTVTFASPVAITANTTYVASYFAPNGRYSVTSSGLSGSAGVTNGSLKALGDSVSENGVYIYGAASAFPTNSYNAGNYFVDVNFATVPAPGTPTNVTATAGQASATVNWTAPSTGGAPSSYEVTPYIGSTAQTPVTVAAPATSRVVTGLTSGTAYTFRVRAINGEGSGPQSAPSNSVTPTGSAVPATTTNVTAQTDSKSAVLSWTPPNDNGAEITGYRVVPYIGGAAQAAVDLPAGDGGRVTGLTNGTTYTFTVAARNGNGVGPASVASNSVTPRDSIFDLATPAIVDGGDNGSVNLGVKFRADNDGLVYGVRFYKASTNTGQHIGTLWDTAGNQLATATFTNETASGWQTVLFANPVAVTANTTYIASYLAPNGHYSVTGAGFGSGAIDNPPLHGLSDSQTDNGVYAYGATTAFPTGSFNAGNYWVDVLYGAGSGA